MPVDRAHFMCDNKSEYETRQTTQVSIQEAIRAAALSADPGGIPQGAGGGEAGWPDRFRVRAKEAA